MIADIASVVARIADAAEDWGVTILPQNCRAR
jgi:hypothetical protein